MAGLYENKQVEERVILLGVETDPRQETMRSLGELEELVKTAGAISLAKIVQNREAIHPATYVGKGKIEELAELILDLEATGIVCDDELSPAQLKNLQEALDCKVMDRTMVILDIFAQRARTSEGKIQVELAQLKYRQAHLIGLGRSLSRLGGGIGTRGPGEKKLEMDRRLIKNRLAQLREELEEVRRHRDLIRSGSKRAGKKNAAIVGYTNAGKSTLLNHLTDAGVLEEDKLFATLDPTTRLLVLPDKQEILLTDTVGFIQKLPHHLIEAFRSTLEEVCFADYIIHVVDASNPWLDLQIDTVYETLKKLGVKNQKIITLFNKQDKLEKETIIKDLRADESLKISARTGEGLEDFKVLLQQWLMEEQVYIEQVFSYDQAGKIQILRQRGKLIKEEYREDGIFVEAYLPREDFGKLR